MMRHNVIAVVSSSLAVLTAGLAIAGGVGPVASSTVTFTATGPAGLKINGNTSGVQAAEKDGRITFSAPVSKFETGIGLRDKHLRNYLETDKHPNAELILDEGRVSLPEDSGVTRGRVTAPLTLHGTTAQVPLTYEIHRHGSDLTVQSDFEVDIETFKIKKPCYLGVCVGDTVKVSVKLQLQKP